MLADVFLNLFPGPGGQGIDFDLTVGLIPLKGLDRGAGYALRAAQSGNPRVGIRQRALKRLNLPDAAARLPVVDAVIKKVDPLLADHFFHGPGIRIIYFVAQPVALLRLGQQLIRFLKQTTGVQGKHPDFRLHPGDHIGQYLVFFSQTARQFQPLTELFAGKADDVLGGKSRCLFYESTHFILHSVLCCHLIRLVMPQRIVPY